MQQRQLVKQSPIRSSYMAYSRHYGRVYAVESTLELDYLNKERQSLWKANHLRFSFISTDGPDATHRIFSLLKAEFGTSLR